MNKKQLFKKYFFAAQKKFGRSTKRLAGDAWPKSWQTLIATIYSAQSRDELTIEVMEKTFRKLQTLEKFAKAPLTKIKNLTKKINFYKTKSKNSKATAQILIKKFKGKIPKTIEQLTSLPGVGRKTANLILSEIHNKEGICVDTHVHRLSNVLGIVKTKTPLETELALKKIAQKNKWSKINRLFVLWGKSVRGKNKKKIIKILNS